MIIDLEQYKDEIFKLRDKIFDQKNIFHAHDLLKINLELITMVGEVWLMNNDPSFHPTPEFIGWRQYTFRDDLKMIKSQLEKLNKNN